MKKMLKYLLFLIIFLFAGFAVFLIYATLDDYKPDEKTIVLQSENADMLSDTLELNMMSWNIGYCGLNAETDFFYDGGKHVRPEEEVVIANLEAVKQFLKSNSDIDIFLLQEVDKNSKRSYGLNEYDSLKSVFPDYQDAYGKNYDVFFVPQPMFRPMGRVNSGLMTLSKYKPESAVRFSFPGNFSWPLGLFFLDRCFLVNQYTLQNDKELLVINTHNSAYDDGSLRDRQLSYLKDFILSEYKKGNYVIVGGDWNQCPADFKAAFPQNKMDNENRKDIPSGYLPEWTWAYDNSVPSNRRVSAPYNPESSLTTVIDYFLLSPNIELKKIKTKHLNFKNSDHNPVFIRLKLK